jgi:phosphate/sulfate permease
VLDINGEMLIIGLVNRPGLSVSSTAVIRSTIIGICWFVYQAIKCNIFLINEIVES